MPAHRAVEETARVEDRLLESSAVDALVNAFINVSGTSFDNILEPYVLKSHNSRP